MMATVGLGKGIGRGVVLGNSMDISREYLDILFDGWFVV